MQQQQNDAKDREYEDDISHAERLPLEVWTAILAFLSLKELCSLSCTSKSMRNLTLTELRAHRVSLFGLTMKKSTMSKVMTFLGENCLRLASLDLSAWEDLGDKFMFEHLPRFSMLQRLIMPGFDMSHLIVGVLPSTLTELNLCNVSRFNDVGMKRLSTRCPNLRILNVGGTSLTNKVLPYLPTQLEELDLSYCQLSGQQRCIFPTKLTVLKLQGISALSVSLLKSLPPSLTYLDLSQSSWPLPSTRAWDRLHNLQTLILAGLSLEYYSLWSLPETLKSLSLSGCRTDYSLKYLPPSLES
jgi:hypothetical protein